MGDLPLNIERLIKDASNDIRPVVIIFRDFARKVLEEAAATAEQAKDGPSQDRRWKVAHEIADAIRESGNTGEDSGG